MGHDVVHVSNPISLAHVLALRDPEVRRRAAMALPRTPRRIDGARFTVPLSVFPLSPDPIGRPLTLGSTSLLRRALRRAGFTEFDLMLVDQPLLDYLIEPMGAHRVFYRPTDLNVDRLTRAAEERLLVLADGVVATSQVVSDALRVRHPEQRYRVVENGAQISHFSARHTQWGDRRGAVYVGALDRRFDWPTVAGLARSAPRVRIDIFGPAASRPPSLPANVFLPGPVDYTDLPRTLARYRVGLLPLSDEETNIGRSPMKLYEYLASGLNVLTRATGPITARPLHDVHAYVDQESADAGYRLSLENEPSGDGAAAAREMDWSARARLVLTACEAMSA
jgi:teichuronic acid biosynthesis glycosyltransferase TuaH